MNKTILLTCTLLVSVCLYGQVNENGFVIRLNGNYNEENSGNTLQYVNAYNVKSKNGNVSITAGYLYQHWLFGLGFEYNHSKTESRGELLELSNSVAGGTSTTNMSLFMEQNIVPLNMYGGTFF